jgi:hypothetical protein
MKLITASVLLCSVVSLVACAPDGRDGGMGDDGDGDGSGSGSGSGNGSGEPRRCNKMDLVFVVDDSGSMSEEQGNLASNFPMFATVLQNYVNADGEHIDFRIAVTTTGKPISYTISLAGMTFPPMSETGPNGAFVKNCGVAQGYLDISTPNLGTTLGCRANVGTGGASYEMPLLMTKHALSERVADGKNAGFLRDDALLGVVMLTDEDDGSSTQDMFMIDGSNPNSGPTLDWGPAETIAFLDTLKGHRSRWAAGVIAGETSCNSTFGNAAEATRLKQFVQMTNQNGSQQAVFSSICAGNLSMALSDVIAKFQAACGGIIL